MRNPIFCPVCGAKLGVEVTYPWTAYGQDPPEVLFDHEDDVVYDKNDVAYCNQSCLDRATGTEEEPPDA